MINNMRIFAMVFVLTWATWQWGSQKQRLSNAISRLQSANDINNYYARKQLLLSAPLSYRNSACLSVCLSHEWIRQKRCKIESPNLTFGCLEDS